MQKLECLKFLECCLVTPLPAVRFHYVPFLNRVSRVIVLHGASPDENDHPTPIFYFYRCSAIFFRRDYYFVCLDLHV